jgi:murein DD-endopeptidase MepM/ murein hydrolase activator NlpD
VSVFLAAALFFAVLPLQPVPARAATVAQLKAQLAALRKQAEPAGREYEAAVDRLENTQYRIAKTDRRIKAATRKLASAETTLAMRVDALYRDGGDMALFEFVLGATSWDEFVNRLEYATMIASSDAMLVGGIKQKRAKLKADRAELVAQSKQEKKDVAKAKRTMNAMESVLRSRKAQYDRVLSSIAADGVSRGVSYPPGPDGMVFPVRGVHFYANTWGAPRSGGRHHMGTDIMSPRGTPVVACVSGRANVHWNSLGGKSITLTGDNGWSYYYAHLNGYAVSSGRVKRGQVIGYVGNSGNAAGGPNHLHFQMGPHGRWVNPYPYLRRME